MFCPQCGNESTGNPNFCIHCGARLDRTGLGVPTHRPESIVEKVCRDFYDPQIFHPSVDLQIFWQTMFDSVVEADHLFASIDQAQFRREMTAIRMDLFGLALSHKFKGTKSALAESFFTKRYLDENGTPDIWDIMGEYNQMVARSTVVNADGKQKEGRIGRAQIVGSNASRVKLFNDWAELNIGKRPPTEEDKERLRCVARVANRIGADVRRADCVATKLLCSRLADRLGCDPKLKSEALFRLAAIVFGLYAGAEEYLKSA